MNFYAELSTRIDEHKALQNAIAANANALVRLLEGNLRHVSVYRLAELKRELRDFNIHTKSWKHR